MEHGTATWVAFTVGSVFCLFGMMNWTTISKKSAHRQALNVVSFGVVTALPPTFVPVNDLVLEWQQELLAHQLKRLWRSLTSYTGEERRQSTIILAFNRGCDVLLKV
jgi:hypothetical protein